MPKRSTEPLVKVTINLYEESYRQMGELYPDIGPQVAVREVVKAHVASQAAKRARAVENLVPEIQLEEKDV